MNRLFGKKKEPTPKPTLGDASARLDARSGVVDTRIAKLDADLLKMKTLISKTSGSTQQRHKQRAVQLLQQKRMYQNQQDVMMQQQFNMDQLQFTTEAVKDTKVQVDAMKDAGKTLKKEFKKFKLSDVEAMQDELRELYEDTQEIQEIMGRAYDVPEDVDDDELLGELEALDRNTEQELDSSYLAEALAPPNLTLPSAPEKEKPEEETADPYSLEAQLGL